ncbi:NRDE protein-domain-containing protein [Aspergillus pseudodeflectus]|uniref:NRDE protein-domain-containing protein n=1 Tax=Aspergillus pseudodeflectus TaxID=176178 RepID=A0ABR4JHQ4_9EURO
MCIALISTSHPDYSLIIINNRDEYLRRPTHPASWWPAPNSQVLGGRDLARKTQGTWMGVTKTGKVAILTNYRESTSDAATGQQSRGAIVNSWLTRTPDDPTTTYVEEMVASPTARNVGGFSLVCGYVNEPLAIVSNRSSDMEQITWIAGETGQTKGLSNTVFDDRSWPKILDGEKLVEEAIGKHVEGNEGEEELIERFLEVLDTNSLPALDDDATAEDYLPYFRRSIFIPLIGTKEKSKAPSAAAEIAAPPSSCVEGHGAEAAPIKKQADDGHDILDKSYLHGPYGTQKQTVILVQKDGRVKYFERTLYDQEANPVPVGEGDRTFEYQVAR